MTATTTAIVLSLCSCMHDNESQPIGLCTEGRMQKAARWHSVQLWPVVQFVLTDTAQL